MKHAYKGTRGERNFSVAGSFRFIQVLVIWINGTQSPLDCKYFPLNLGFRYVQVLFKKISYVCVFVCVRVYVYVYRPTHSQAWSVVLNYVKALHCPIHPREGGWTGPPVRVNGTIRPASNSRKTDSSSVNIGFYLLRLTTSLLSLCTIETFTVPGSKEFLMTANSAFSVFHPVSKLLWIPAVVRCTAE